MIQEETGYVKLKRGSKRYWTERKYDFIRWWGSFESEHE